MCAIEQELLVCEGHGAAANLDVCALGRQNFNVCHSIQQRFQVEVLFRPGAVNPMLCALRFPVDSPERFRVEVLFSPGAAHNPFEVVPIKQDHTLPVTPRQPLHEGALPLAGPVRVFLTLPWKSP